MKNYFYSFSLLVLAMCLASMGAFAQGVTTSSLSGVVTDADGAGLEGATIVAVHTPTGSKYGIITRKGGLYTMRNLRVGGPYSVTAQFVGFQKTEKTGVMLTLGRDQQLNFALGTEDVQLEEVLISAHQSILSTQQTGSETGINQATIQKMPTVTRDISDFTRLTPQAAMTEDADGELGVSIAGQNNRFNSLFIDGAISNDVFGLADQGTNGGQAGISPISIDAIKEFNILIAPYDVTLGGFSGAGINAVTRSGSNKVDGSVYWLFRNQALAGKTPIDDPAAERTKLADFSSNLAGFRIGGPLIKDKLFFFLNAEVERRNTPQPFDFNSYDGDTRTTAGVDSLVDFLKTQYGYDPGTYLDNPKTVKAEKLLVKIDWNISENHKLSARYSYSNGRAEKTNPSSNRSIRFSNGYEFFPTITHSGAVELNSVFGNKAANKLILGITSVRDDRDPLGSLFPRVEIADGSGRFVFGSEPFSTANKLNQDIITLTDNFNLYSGNHTFTFGTHNEFYRVFNLFVRQNYGEYDYDNLDDFYNDAGPSLYQRGYSLVDLTENGEVDGKQGDEISNAAADFWAMQLGFFAQDEWKASKSFTLTYGLRVDIPTFLGQPAVDTFFNNNAIPAIEAQGYDLEGARSGQMPQSQVLFSPRVGFRVDVGARGKTIVRGGAGIFTSRLPLVWAAGAYTNNGITVGGVFQSDPMINGQPIPFQPDLAQQYTATDFGSTDPIPSGQMDLFSSKLKFPQVMRASLGVDQALGWGLTLSGDLIYTKNVNTIFYRNYNLKPSVGNLEGADTREYFDRRDEVVPEYTRIIWGGNTSVGSSFNGTITLRKTFQKGFEFMLAYNYGSAMALNDLTSSQNSSQWRNIEVGPYGKNDLQATISDFSMGSRIVFSGAYSYDITDWLGATISAYYNGQSGEVFSYVYSNGPNRNRARDITAQDSRDFTDLIFVPATMSDIVLIPIEDGAGNVLVSAEDQWTALDAYINQDSYLKNQRGQYAERNAQRTPMTHIVDLRLLVDITINSGANKHRFQLSWDVFNFGNMLNKNWGRRYRSNFNGVSLIQFAGFSGAGGPPNPGVPTYQFDPSQVTDYNGDITTLEKLNIDDTGLLSSRWQSQIGLRYIFN